MAAPSGILRVQRHEQTVTCRVEGRGTRSQGLALRRFGEQSVALGASALCVDLRHCTYMDSTFIGTLLCLHRSLANHGAGTFIVASPSPPCMEILHQMKLDRLFTLQETDDREGDWRELHCDLDDVSAFQANTVQAHQELAGLPGPVGQAFARVAECLTEEMAARNAEHK
jgi:anti-anti-sigma regulatory factor